MGQDFDRGLEKLNQKDYAGAIEEFTRALQVNPELVESLLPTRFSILRFGTRSSSSF